MRPQRLFCFFMIISFGIYTQINMACEFIGKINFIIKYTSLPLSNSVIDDSIREMHPRANAATLPKKFINKIMQKLIYDK